ncbi:MAG: PrsW family glutamic-type intramembrane protease [Desulfobacteraceae bacterium]
MNPVSLTAALAPAALLMWFFHSRDVHPEPAGVVWMTFFLGVAAVLPISLVAGFLSSAVSRISAGNIYFSGALTAFVVAAVPEEFFKYKILTRYAMQHPEFDEPMDGIVYGVAASLGFATFENIQYVAEGGMGIALARALTAVPGHAMMGAVMGYFAGQALCRPERASRMKRMALWCPVMLHGLYDTPLMIFDHAVKSGIRLAGSAQLITILSVVAVLTTEMIWAMRLVMRLRSRQLSIPKVPMDKQWYWTWTRIIFGGVLAAGAGMAILFIITALPDKLSGIGIAPVNTKLALLTVVLLGIGGLMLFRSGLKAKAALERDT